MPAFEDVLGYDIKVGDVQYPNTFATDVEIDSGDIDTCFQNQSMRFAYYGTLAEMAKRREAQLKNMLKLVEAKLDCEIRAEWAKAAPVVDPKAKVQKEARLTEAMVEHQIIADPRYQKCYKEYLDAGYTTGVLLVAKDSFAQRKDMLISLGANKRSLNNEPRLLK